jgi:phosphoglycolate phosphatase-like HAD superfamily hydrolase
MNFLGIIFDFGFTLFEFKEVSLDKYLDCFKIGLIKTLTELKNMNIVVDVNLLERIKKDFNRLRAFYFKDSIKTKEEHNTSSILKEVLENHGITNLKSSFYENLADIYHSFELDEWIPFESTIPTLNNIRKSKNLKLGIISNHPHHKTIELLT